MIWGHARDNRGPGKVGVAITTYNALVTTLRTSMALLDLGKLAGAYASCTYLQAGYLAGFGESFFTKWLWSAGLAAGQRPLPLVFDDRVRAALRTIGPTWALAGGNAGQRYEDYCTLADHVATDLAEGPLGHTNAGNVEYAL